MSPFELHSDKGTQVKISDVVIGKLDPENVADDNTTIIPQICLGE
jgi:hypothetical protein